MIMKKILTGFLVLAIMAGSCKKNPDDTNPTPSEPTVITDSMSSTIGANGGTVKLSDGCTVVVAPGELNSDATVTLCKIGNENIFTAENRSAYDISGLPSGTIVTFKFRPPDPVFVNQMIVNQLVQTKMSDICTKTGYATSITHFS